MDATYTSGTAVTLGARAGEPHREEVKMAKASQPADARFAEQVRAAPFIFTGQIVKARASGIAALAPDERIAVVRVATVLRAPPVLGALGGKLITIQLAEGRPMKVGAKALFYAASWLYGEGIAVVEVARESVPRDAKAMLAAVAQAELRIEDGKLRARLELAELVLTGMVVETDAVEPEDVSPRSEHDPMWWRAEIAIDQTEKGALDEARHSAYFPSSLDVYWLEVPKLQPGQRGTFILHRHAEGKKALMPPPGLALLHPLDFQLPAEVNRVRALLKLTPG